MAVAFHRLRIADVRRETPEAVSIAFTIPPALAADYAYDPGQHLTLRTKGHGGEVRRSYSICSGLDDGELRVAIKKVDGGLFSCLANDTLKAGDTIDVMTPQGRFGLTPDAVAKTYLAIAAGSGITPIMSVLRSVLAREPKSRFTLIYGNRSTPSIIFKEALEDLKDRAMERFAVHHVLSREPQEVDLLNGRIDGDKIAAFLRTMGPSEAIDHVFLCGPGGLIEEGKTTLIRLGVRPERIHVEYFSTDGLPVVPRPRMPAETVSIAAPIATATITLQGARHDVPVFDGETIIEAGLRAGLEMPYSCRGGMCCTCRARLTAGEVRMDLNYSLEPWEMRAGYVLTCQSHPTTPRVAVDYDQV